MWKHALELEAKYRTTDPQLAWRWASSHMKHSWHDFGVIHVSEHVQLVHDINSLRFKKLRDTSNTSSAGGGSSDSAASPSGS